MTQASIIHSQFGPWRLLERIGAGGVAEVFRAEHHEDHGQVAIKVLRDEWCEDKESAVDLKPRRSSWRRSSIRPCLEFAARAG